MTRGPKGPAPPDPGIIPGGIRDRSLPAVLERGPVPEDPERTKLSQEYWRHFREKQARGEEAGSRLLGRPPPVEFVIKKTKLPAPNLWVVTTEIADPHRLQPYETFTVDDSTGEVTHLISFATAAAALQQHDQMTRAALKEAAE